jgi:hypothetical protein
MSHRGVCGGPQVLAFNWDTSADTPQAVLGASNVSPAKYFVYKVRGHYVGVGMNGPERRGAQARAFVPCARARVCLRAFFLSLSFYVCVYICATHLCSPPRLLRWAWVCVRFGR